MNDIKVVPNPYIVGHRFESPLPPGITSGRGSRKLSSKICPPTGWFIFSHQEVSTLERCIILETYLVGQFPGI